MWLHLFTFKNFISCIRKEVPFITTTRKTLPQEKVKQKKKKKMISHLPYVTYVMDIPRRKKEKKHRTIKHGF